MDLTPERRVELERVLHEVELLKPTNMRALERQQKLIRTLQRKLGLVRAPTAKRRLQTGTY